MSGGGRQNWANNSENDPRYLIPKSEEETDDKYQATEIEQVLSEELKEINDHNYDAIDKHRNSIQEALQSEFEDVEIVRYAGSHSRHTDVTNVSDVDVLVSMGLAANLPESSNEALHSIAQRLSERFPQTSIDVGNMAVTVTFKDGIEVQVLPAYRYGDSYKIPDPNSSGWITTNPARFAHQLTEVNKQNSGRVIPVIKLVKRICNERGIELKSYHIENLAIKAFENYNNTKSYSVMLEHFFNSAKMSIHQPIQDPSGQSGDVSAYLSTTARKNISTQLHQMELEIAKAKRNSSVQAWRELFE